MVSAGRVGSVTAMVGGVVVSGGGVSEHPLSSRESRRRGSNFFIGNGGFLWVLSYYYSGKRERNQ